MVGCVKRILLAAVTALLATSCWHPNYTDATGQPVKWRCGAITVSADGDPWFNSLVAYTASEITNLTGRPIVYVGAGGAIDVHHSWPASAPYGWGWTGVPPQSDGRLHGGQILINPSVPDWKLLAVIRHEMGHAMGLGHDDDNEPTLMSSAGTGAYDDYTPMDVLGLQTLLTC